MKLLTHKAQKDEMIMTYDGIGSFIPLPYIVWCHRYVEKVKNGKIPSIRNAIVCESKFLCWIEGG